MEFDLKAHTLWGRWIDDKALKNKSVPLSSMSSVVFGIERHTIVSRAIKVGCGKASRMIVKTYRVVSIFDKISNKLVHDWTATKTLEQTDEGRG